MVEFVGVCAEIVSDPHEYVRGWVGVEAETASKRIASLNNG